MNQDPRFQMNMTAQSMNFMGQNNPNMQFNQQQFRMQQQRPQIDGQFMQSMNMQGGFPNQMLGTAMTGIRSQSDLRNNSRLQQRSPTPELYPMQGYNGSSAQTGKNAMNMQNTGYAQPFHMQDRPISQGSGSEMHRNSPGVFEQPIMNQLARAFQHQDQFTGSYMGADQLTQSGFQYSNYPPQFRATQFGRGTAGLDQSQGYFGNFLQDHFGQHQHQVLSYEQIMNLVLMKIKSYERPSQFFNQFDAFMDRKFEVWELMAMFEISLTSARVIAKAIDKQFGAQVPLKQLCQQINTFRQIQIDELGFNGKSEYAEKKYQLQQNLDLLKTIQSFASHLKTSTDFAPNSKSYQEAFSSIVKKSGEIGGQSQITKTGFKRVLIEKCAINLNYNIADKICDFISNSQLSDSINIVQFVNSLRTIELDFQVWDLAKLLEKMKTLTKKPETSKVSDEQHIEKLIEKLRQLIFNENLTDVFQSSFQSKKKLKIKQKQLKKQSADQEAECAVSGELLVFFEQKNSLLNFSKTEMKQIITHYQVDPVLDSTTIISATQQALLSGIQKNQTITNSTQSLQLQNAPAPSPSQSNLLQVPLQQKNMGRDPSSESLGRDLQSSVPENGQLPKIPLPTKQSVPEITENAVREDLEDEEWENDDGVIQEEIVEEELKEGGQKEKNLIYINLDRLFKDLQPTEEMIDPSKKKAEILKFEVLEGIKGWIILTGESVLNTFKLGDRKGTLFASRRQVKSFLSKALFPPDKDIEAQVHSVMTFFNQINEQGNSCINYLQFYRFFYEYANLNRVQVQNLTDPIAKIFNQFNSIKQQSIKSLGVLLQIQNFHTRNRFDTIPYDAIKFFQQMGREINKGKKASASNFSVQYETELTKELNDEAETAKKIKGQNGLPTLYVSLRKFQEKIGFELEKEPEFAPQTVCRQICVRFQLQRINLRELKLRLQKVTNLQMFYNQFRILVNSDQDQNIDIIIQNLCKQYAQNKMMEININKFFGRLEFETNKILNLQRFYVKLKRQIRKEATNLNNYFETKGADPVLREFTREKFIKLLVELELIIEEEDSRELKYYLDEYDPEDSLVIQCKKLEDDFEEFVGSSECLFEKQIDIMMQYIFLYTENGIHKGNIVSALTEAQNFSQKDQNSPPQSVKNSEILNEWLHSYDFTAWFQYIFQVCEQTNLVFDYDVLNLFVEYLGSESLARKSLINMNQLLRRITESYPILSNKTLVKNLARKSAKKLQMHVVNVLEDIQKGPQDFFFGVSASSDEFLRMFEAGPFYLNQVEFSASISEIIQYFQYGYDFVQVDRFVKELQQMLQIKDHKFTHFRNLHRQLNQKGVMIEDAIKMVKGNISIAAGTGFSLENFAALCKGYEIKMDLNTVIKPIFQSFELDSLGEIPLEDFIQEFYRALGLKSDEQSTDQSGKVIKKTQITAERYFGRIEDVLNCICNEIENRNLSEFGSYLKGYDFDETDQIAHSDFFQIIDKIFQNTLGKGDILDLLKYFDPDNTGLIKIIAVSDEFNRRLRSNFVILKSIVAAVIDERIIEPIILEKMKKKSEKTDFYHTLILDLLSALLARKTNLSVQEWLLMFSSSEPYGYIQFSEFKAALDKMDCEGSQEQKNSIFEFIKQHQSHQYTHSMIFIEDLEREILKDYPFQDIETISFELLKKAAPSLADSRIPIRDSCQKYETSWGSGEILYSDFTFELLANELKLKQSLTRNMLDLIQVRYNPNQQQNVAYEPFLQNLQMVEQLLKIKLYMTQYEVDEYLQTYEGKIIAKILVPPKKEPIYYARTNKNTYYEPQLFSVNILTDRSAKKCCDEIVLATRRLGACVELYFQNYGYFSKIDGIRVLEIVDFREALQDLKLVWAQNSNQVKFLFEQIQESCAFDVKKTVLNLENIGCVICQNSEVNLLREEADVLYKIYIQLATTNLIRNVPDLVNFVNFERDGTITLAAFKILIQETFKMNQVIDEALLQILYQRYRVKDSPFSKQTVSCYQFLQDLAYQHLSIGLMIQWAAHIAEKMVKHIQSNLVIETASAGLQDNEVAAELRSYLSKNSMSGGQAKFTYGDLIRLFQNLHLLGEETYEREKLAEDFFKLCSLLCVKDDLNRAPTQKDLLKPVDIQSIDLPSQIDFNQFADVVVLLAGKPLSGLYNDILDAIYISSKKRNISISGPYLLYLFQEDDLQKQGIIQYDIFIKKVQHKILFEEKDVSLEDIVFLSTKYLKNFTTINQYSRLVNYQSFMDDYYNHETGMLGQCMTSILTQSIQSKTNDHLKHLPLEVATIYRKMGQYLKSKDLDELICGKFVYEDEVKCGFLSKVQLKQQIRNCNIPISEHQINLLTNPLRTDKYNRFSYLEMISYLLGEKEMQKVRDENHILTARDMEYYQITKEATDQQIDLYSLKFNQDCIDDIELNLSQIRKEASRLQKGTIYLQASEVQQVFRNSKIFMETQDLQNLNRYIEATKDKQTQNVNLNNLLKHFKIDDAPAALLSNIQQQLRNKGLGHGNIFVNQFLAYGDFKLALQRQGIILPHKDSKQNAQDIVLRLFMLMSKGSHEVEKETIERILHSDATYAQYSERSFR